MAKFIKKFLRSFTLIELIIVIAIISVLGASAFLLVSQWIGKSRDSRRISDLKTLENTIQISFVSKESVNYPDPDPKIEIKYDKYGILWYQGKFGETMTDFVGMLNKIPKDPRGDYYEYSLTQDKKFYQLLAILENEKQISYGIDNVYANDYETTFILTNYRGYLIKKLGEELYLIKTDTLMVDPVKIDEYNGDYELDSQQDILKQDDSYDNRSQVNTGNVTGLLSDDATVRENTINEIKTTFPEFDNNSAIDELIKTTGIVKNSESMEKICEAHEYDGYSFDLILHSQSQTKIKIVNITDGTNTLQLTANCNNGTVSYSTEQSEINCLEGYTIQGGVCSKNERLSGTWGVCSESCGGGTQTRQVECKTTGGTTLTDADCIETKPTTSQTCNTQSCVTYSWDATSWGTCSGGTWSSRGACSVTCGGGIQYRTCNSSSGTQTRTVECKDNTGTVVSDSYCISPKPSTSQSCTSSNCTGSSSQSCNTQTCVTYTWQVGSWGACSTTCGSGTQSRSVTCRSSLGSTVSDYYCSGIKPSTTQTCSSGTLCAILILDNDNVRNIPVNTVVYPGVKVSSQGLYNCTWCGYTVNCNGTVNTIPSGQSLVNSSLLSSSGNCIFTANNGSFTRTGSSTCTRYSASSNWTCVFYSLY
ncbi:MAG: thrombospondin type-1 domain-containing protein [Candidatus Absconditabacteria bacterium]